MQAECSKGAPHQWALQKQHAVTPYNERLPPLSQNGIVPAEMKQTSHDTCQASGSYKYVTLALPESSPLCPGVDNAEGPNPRRSTIAVRGSRPSADSVLKMLSFTWLKLVGLCFLVVSGSRHFMLLHKNIHLKRRHTSA